MKAGSSGSNPDGISSQPLRELLRDIGQAVFVLNTAVVGLDAVENGHEKPETLNISWTPKDPTTAARKSRKFILESVLVRVSEAINQYVSALSRLPRFADVRENWGDSSSSEKVSAIAVEVLDRNDYLIPAVLLVVHWRNRVVHRHSSAKFKHQEKRVLLECGDIIAERYRGLDICELLKHFDDRRPTLKDISSLVAMRINLARKIDGTMPRNLDKAELDVWLGHYQLTPMVQRIKLETSPEKQQASVCRLLKSQAPNLLNAYLDHYRAGPP